MGLAALILSHFQAIPPSLQVIFSRSTNFAGEPIAALAIHEGTPGTVPRPPPLSSGGAPRSVTALSTAARVGALATSTPAALQPPAVPDRPRPARGPLAAALQAQPCDRAEMFLARGCPFSQDAVRDWEARFAPPMVALVGHAANSWR